MKIPPKSAKPRVLLISTGGTIAMTPGASGGVTPTLTGDDLVQNIPALADHCELDVLSYATRPGASLTIADMRQIAEIIAESFQRETAGAIVVQGTDTIEETSFILDLLVSSNKPVIVTGAMRSATASGADGPANLLASVITAVNPASWGRGTLVVLNDEIHAARRVCKSHTASLGAFTSPGFGPVGHILEYSAVFHGSVPRTPPLAQNPSGDIKPVAIVKVGLDDDGRLMRALPSLCYAGVVIEAMGAGHLPEWYADLVSELARSMPIVLSTRVPAGPVFSKTYSFKGSETDTLARGAIPGGMLSSVKARLLLSLLLAEELQGDDLKREFLRRAYLAPIVKIQPDA